MKTSALNEGQQHHQQPARILLQPSRRTIDTQQQQLQPVTPKNNYVVSKLPTPPSPSSVDEQPFHPQRLKPISKMKEANADHRQPDFHLTDPSKLSKQDHHQHRISLPDCLPTTAIHLFDDLGAVMPNVTDSHLHFLRLLGTILSTFCIIEFGIAADAFQSLNQTFVLYGWAQGAFWGVILLGCVGFITMCGTEDCLSRKLWVVISLLVSMVGMVFSIWGAIWDGLAYNYYKQFSSCAGVPSGTRGRHSLAPMFYGSSSTFWALEQCLGYADDGSWSSTHYFSQFDDVVQGLCYCATNAVDTGPNNPDIHVDTSFTLTAVPSDVTGCVGLTLSGSSLVRDMDCSMILTTYPKELATSSALSTICTVIAIALSVYTCRLLVRSEEGRLKEESGDAEARLKRRMERARRMGLGCRFEYDEEDYVALLRGGRRVKRVKETKPLLEDKKENGEGATLAARDEYDVRASGQDTKEDDEESGRVRPRDPRFALSPRIATNRPMMIGSIAHSALQNTTDATITGEYGAAVPFTAAHGSVDSPDSIPIPTTPAAQESALMMIDDQLDATGREQAGDKAGEQAEGECAGAEELV